MELLLEAASDKEVKDTQDGCAPLTMANPHDDTDAVRMWIKATVDPNRTENSMFFSLTHAALVGNITVLRKLMAAGAEQQIYIHII